MTLAVLAALALALAQAGPPVTGTGSAIEDAGRAIEAGRLDQARSMIARAKTEGAKGAAVDRALADLAFASGKDAEALSRYRDLHRQIPNDSSICERGVIAALRSGATNDASLLIDCATAGEGASWRAWNARGVLADERRDWAGADAAYARARAIAPLEGGVANNQGWSYLLRGDWLSARSCFKQAFELDPGSARIANNLELAEAALADDLPRRGKGETDASWASRLNDAGVAASLLGDTKRAVAAFTQALEARGSYYSRAGNNLKAAKNQ
jgi:Flp pilus assembly protein TadD